MSCGLGLCLIGRTPTRHDLRPGGAATACLFTPCRHPGSVWTRGAVSIHDHPCHVARPGVPILRLCRLSSPALSKPVGPSLDLLYQATTVADTYHSLTTCGTNYLVQVHNHVHSAACVLVSISECLPATRALTYPTTTVTLVFLQAAGNSGQVGRPMYTPHILSQPYSVSTKFIYIRPSQKPHTLRACLSLS